MDLFGEPVCKLKHAGVLRNSSSPCSAWSGSSTLVPCVHISSSGLVERAQDGTVRLCWLDDDWKRRIAMAKPKCTLPNRSSFARRLLEDSQDCQRGVCGQRCSVSHWGLVRVRAAMA